MCKVWENGSHPYLVSLRQSFIDGHLLVIIMEYCDSGDLRQRITDQRTKDAYFDEELIRSWVFQLLSAVDFLHYSKILHRDIKPANVFMHHGNDVKLGDLGLAKNISAASAAAKHTQCGSPLYTAPEVQKGEEYAKAVDICNSLPTLSLAFI